MTKQSIILVLFMSLWIPLKTIHPLHAQTSNNNLSSIESILEKKLLDPLRKKESERSKFSRALLPPTGRKIRIENNTPQTDPQGHSFISFSIDENRGYAVNPQKSDHQWLKNAIVGCMYPASGEVMVKRGNVFYPASILWGAQVTTASLVCQSH
ncbi:MAG: hypothetical protein JNK65_06465 [Deltaproteobacteria bacterium]|nr:hypothetical protein [Deltaproteobacteria bacterium]